MASTFAEVESPSYDREIDYRRTRKEDDRDESTEKSLKRTRTSPTSLEDRRSSISPPSSRYVKEQNIDDPERSPKSKKWRSGSPTSPDNEEDHSMEPPRHKRPRNYYHDESTNLDNHQESSVKSSKERSDSPSSSSMTKGSRKSRSPRHTSHKHKKHKRSRSREGGKQSDSKRSTNRDNSGSSSRKRSRSPREKDRIKSKSFDYNEARKSPDRKGVSHLYETSTSDTSSTPSSNRGTFKIPKRKREEEEELEDVYKRERKVEKKPKISDSLLKEIRNLVKTEHHHIESRSVDAHGDVTEVNWCYSYLDPRIPGHITGGRAHLHHLCRVCKRTCLHLLGTYNTGSRQCLACASSEYGWKEDEVPSWYFHDKCKHCENDPKRRGFGGGNRGSWYRPSNYGNRTSYYGNRTSNYGNRY